MAYARYGQHDKSFICDTVEDLKNLPQATIGSSCYVIENASKYIVNSKGEWIRQTYGNVPTGGGGSVDLSAYATIELLTNEIEKLRQELNNQLTQVENNLNEKIDTLESDVDIKIEKIREEVGLDDAIFEGGEI